MNELTWYVAPPSPHILAHAGVDLVYACPPRLRVLPAEEVAVVLSRSRKPEVEVDLAACAAASVPVVVRPTGGGAVVLAPGVVTLSALVSAGPSPWLAQRQFAFFCGLLQQALQYCGVGPLAFRGVSDLCWGDRKVVGTALRLLKDRVLFQASVLVDLDVALLERFLKFPSRAPAYRRGRSHREFVVPLRQAGFAVSVEELVQALERTFHPALAQRGQ